MYTKETHILCLATNFHFFLVTIFFTCRIGLLSQANFFVLLLKNWANTVSQQVNPLSITTDNTLVNHTTRTATDGVFRLQHKKGAKRKRTATSTSASVARLVHVPHQGNTNSIPGWFSPYTHTGRA